MYSGEPLPPGGGKTVGGAEVYGRILGSEKASKHAMGQTEVEYVGPGLEYTIAERVPPSGK